MTSTTRGVYRLAGCSARAGTPGGGRADQAAGRHWPVALKVLAPAEGGGLPREALV
ncbi:MAG TPA: hypothetical protein VHS99_02875 [Chloroflexota bacterium]|nr:hypothetical protein [Chloroflexota bacterium]